MNRRRRKRAKRRNPGPSRSGDLLVGMFLGAVGYGIITALWEEESKRVEEKAKALSLNTYV